MIIQDWSQIEVWNLAAAKRKLQIPDPTTPQASFPASPLFELAASAGKLTGVRRFRAMGHNPDVDTGSVPEDIWESGGLYPFQATAQLLEIVSTSAADTAAGTGMRSVTVEGLDASYNEISETVTLNGVGVVPLVRRFLRINNCTGAAVGSGGTNVGVVTLRVAGGGATQAIIDTGDSRAQQAIFTVPNGKTAFLTSTIFQFLRTATSAENMEIGLHVRLPQGVNTVAALFGMWSSGTSAPEFYLQYPPAFPEHTDVWPMVHFVTANNSSVAASLFFVLIDNNVW